MGAQSIGDLVGHAFGHGNAFASFDFGEDLAFEDEEQMPFFAPVVREIVGRIVYLPDTGASDVDSSPCGKSCFSRMDGGGDVGEVGGLEWDGDSHL